MISHLLEDVGKTRILGNQENRCVCDSNLKRGTRRLLATLHAIVILSPTINIRIVAKIFFAYLVVANLFLISFFFFIFTTEILNILKRSYIILSLVSPFNR